MPDTEKPFILIRRNRFIFNITPRNASGWWQMGIWTVLLAPVVFLFHRYTDGLAEGPQLTRAVAVFLLATTVWAVGGIWWMKARAEVVDVEQLLRQQREAARKGRRGR